MSTRVILPQDVFRRSTEPHQLPEGLRLVALEWALYFAVTGVHTAAELGRQLRTDATDRDRALGRLIRLGLIEEQALSAAEYVRALAAAGDHEEKTLREFLMGAAHGAVKPSRAEPAGPEQTAMSAHGPEPSPVPLSRPQPLPATQPESLVPSTRPSAPLAFRRLPAPDDRKENSSMSQSRKLSLRALMSLIEAQAGSREAGQIDIYRVFVRVDTSLLKRSGIETLRFTEDRFVSDPELEQALVRSVKKTLGLECPEHLWVEVA